MKAASSQTRPLNVNYFVSRERKFVPYHIFFKIMIEKCLKKVPFIFFLQYTYIAIVNWTTLNGIVSKNYT